MQIPPSLSFNKINMLMISLDVYPDSLVSFNKINQVDDFVRCLSRFPPLSFLIESTVLMISLDVYPYSPLSLF